MTFESLKWTNSIIRLTSITLILQILYSFKLWVNYRDFPLVPVFEGVSFINDSLSFLTIGLLLGLLFINVIRPKIIINCLISFLLIILILDDINRLQPWVYLYIIIFLSDSVNKVLKKEELIFKQLQIIFIGLYFWSGVSKINYYFLDHTFLEILSKTFKFQDLSFFLQYKEIGFVIPIIEIATALLLITNNYPKVGVVLAVLTHAFIIYFVGPFSIGNDYIVIPWNLLMIVLLCVFYFKNVAKNICWHKLSEATTMWVLALLVLVLPFLNLFSKWDNFLSFNLYSDKCEQLLIVVEDNFLNHIDEKERKQFKQITSAEGGRMLNLSQWAFSELRTPYYPEDWVLDRICNNFFSKTLIMLTKWPNQDTKACCQEN